jgi:TRAP-type C4-dicarboxylate transport system substrate-binding protein
MRNFTLREHVILSARDLKGILKLRNNSSNVHLHQMTGESRAEVFTNSIRT